MKALGNIANFIDALNSWVGRTTAWLTLIMVLVQFAIVILRYYFNWGQVWVQEIVLYCHAIVFMVATGYTLLNDGHVRIDIVFQKLNPKQKAWINLAGCGLALIPFCLVVGYQSWPLVRESWRVWEGSKDGGGLEAVYILKSFILVFCLLTFLQGISCALRSIIFLKGSGND